MFNNEAYLKSAYLISNFEDFCNTAHAKLALVDASMLHCMEHFVMEMILLFQNHYLHLPLCMFAQSNIVGLGDVTEVSKKVVLSMAFLHL